MTEWPTNTDKWIEVDLDAIGHNLEEIKRMLQPGTRLMAVVKANAYGLGAVPVARELIKLGVDLLGVTFLREALQLRYNEIDEDILVFSPLLPEEYLTAIEHNIIVSVGSAKDLSLVERAAAQLGRRARVHIKIDTGLGRFGLEIDEAEPVVKEAYASKEIVLEGIYTHFAAGVDDAFTVKQFTSFRSLLDSLEKQGISIPWRHCCSSSSFLRHPYMHLEMVRLGTVLYGQFPAGKVMPEVKLKECYRFKARISAVRDFKRGSYLGYYRTYRLPHDSRVAVIPVGLVDGFGVEAIPKPSGVIDFLKMGIKLLASFLNLNRTALTATINGKPAYIRGKMFMQFCLVEIPSPLGVEPGDVVELPVKRTLASLAVPRFYLREGRGRADDNDVLPVPEPGFIE
ncbi:MAG: alanine racemase [Syntrophomonadaceae bacterium]|jgi:alanine racemase|nr:alanine racemase [Syntrophomonadaceae bacterium]